MNFIHSFYPDHKESDLISSKQGFISPEFNWMSWSLSCLQIFQLYGSVTLYTSNLGNEILIEKLKLPYTNVIINELNYHPKLWALNKIHTYSLQQEPFIHIDGDVFIWEKFDTSLVNSELISQNIENCDLFYRTIINELISKGVDFPKKIFDQIRDNRNIKSCNAGVFGGTDTDFFSEYASLVFSFVNNNYDKILDTGQKDVNMVFEQLFFYHLAIKNEKAIACFIPEEISDMNYPDLANFHDVPFKTKYIHMLGKYKQNPEACKMLAKRLRLSFPDHYYNIINFLQKENVKMYMGAYNLNDLSISTKLDLNITSFYDDQLNQQKAGEIVFSNTQFFLEATFTTNSYIIENYDLNTMPSSIKTICSLEGKLIDLTIDEMECIILDVLRTPKTIEGLLTELSKYFDTNLQEEEKKDLLDLLKLKIRRGCENNIFHIVTDNINQTAKHEET
ncbi:DUF6734 family protein [Pedobacter sp. PWIIR3]